MFSILKVGADVEVFLREMESNKLVTAIGKVGGTKEEPRKILEGRGSAVQEDNCMLEFNIVPAENEQSWRHNINKVLVHIFEEMAAKGYVVDIVPSVIFEPEDLKHPQAQTMGCDPDVCAWTGEPNELIKPAALGNLRTSGGHVHVSFMVDGNVPNLVQKINLIRMLDLALGVPSILLDTDSDRRRHYGRAGAFRTKGPNHVEYRTLSNFWIKNDSLKEWVFKNVIWAIKELNSRGQPAKEGPILELYTHEVNNCIKNSDTIIAKNLVDRLRIPMPG